MQKNKPFGKLSPVALREYWKDESQEFTPWLSKEENLNLLGEAIGMELELVEKEHPVGNFKVDILAKIANFDEENQDESHLAVIENQLEKTNHKHLGQLLTYASGLKAKAVVWIAKKMDDEHKKALDWLNDNSSEDVSFFGLEIELWQIGDSTPAPKFNVVSKPNDWFKTVQQQKANLELSPTKILQKEFWLGFVEYMQTHKTNLSLSAPRPQHWYTLSVGRTGFQLQLTVDSQKKQLGCRLRLRKTERGWNALYQDKERVEKELSAKLEWKELPNNIGSVIAQYSRGNFQNREEWPQLFQWLKERAEAFYHTFSERIQNIDPDHSPMKKMDRSEEAA